MKTIKELMKEESEITSKWFEEWHLLGGPKSGRRPDWEYDDKIKELRKEWRQSLNVGDRVHICHYTDITPGTVIKKTPTTLVVRNDKAELDGNWKPEFIPGGFSAHCTNDDEQVDHWVIEEDLEGSTEVFRWSKRYNRYKNKSGEFCEPGWYKYYDYNF